MSWIQRFGRALFGLKDFSKKESFKKDRQRSADTPVRAAFNKIKAENKKRDSKINKIFNKLSFHYNTLESHSKLIGNLEKQVSDLKETITELKLSQSSRLNTINRPINRLNPINLNTVKDAMMITSNQQIEQKLGLSKFTTQEKKIIASLFEHKGMALSYQDIAKLLDKSPITIKSQINQLKTKTNLIEEQTDTEGKRRFRLKENVRIEGFLTGD